MNKTFPQFSLLTVIACLFFTSCASVSESNIKQTEIDGKIFKISARAERGISADKIFININGEDVASGTFDAQNAGTPETVFNGTYLGHKIKANCNFRWRPGFYIGYRCEVYIDDKGPVELDF